MACRFGIGSAVAKAGGGLNRMGVKVRQTSKGWFVFIAHKGQRRALKAASKRAAEVIRDQIDARLKLGNYELVRSDAAPSSPPLRVALTDWIQRRRAAGDIRPSSALSYLSRARRWTFAQRLPDGRQLGDVPITQVTREYIGAVLTTVKLAGKSA